MFKAMTISLTTSLFHKSTISSLDALANINITIEHTMTNSLRLLLEMSMYMVSSKKKKKEEEGSMPSLLLGIIDLRLMHVCVLSRAIDIYT